MFTPDDRCFPVAELFSAAFTGKKTSLESRGFTSCVTQTIVTSPPDQKLLLRVIADLKRTEEEHMFSDTCRRVVTETCVKHLDCDETFISQDEL